MSTPRLIKTDLLPQDLQLLQKFKIYITPAEYLAIAQRATPTPGKMRYMLRQIQVAHAVPKATDFVVNLGPLISAWDTAFPPQSGQAVIFNLMCFLQNSTGHSFNAFMGNSIRIIGVDYRLVTTNYTLGSQQRESDHLRIMMFQWNSTIQTAAITFPDGARPGYVTDPSWGGVLQAQLASGLEDPNSALYAPINVSYKKQIKVLFNRNYAINAASPQPLVKDCLVDHSCFEPFCENVYYSDKPGQTSVPIKGAICLLVQNLRRGLPADAAGISNDALVGIRFTYINA